MYIRELDLKKLLQKKSFFLFGPRSTGKTTLLKQQLENAILYDLLESKTYRRLLKNPELIGEECSPNQLVVIDEVQRLPDILNEVHRLIESKGYKFLLTGSSARKLRHGGANLLAGRAWSSSMFPLTSSEISDFDILKYLNYGGLPQIYTSEDPLEELDSYVSTYLQEEIKAEAVTRNVQAFADFLDVIALSNGAEINYEGLASDCQVSPSTLKNYLQILDDTLLGFHLPSYVKTKKRKAISRAKYYLFDVGVANYLANRSNIKKKSKEFGDALEHFVILEMRAYLSYRRIKKNMYYWRSTSRFEVDLLIDDECAIEIKSCDLVAQKHLKGIRALKEEELHSRYIVISNDVNKRVTDDGIEIYPWSQFLQELWDGKIVI